MAHKYLRDCFKSLGAAKYIKALARSSEETAEIHVITQYRAKFIERFVGIGKRHNQRSVLPSSTPVRRPKDEETRKKERREHRQKLKEAKELTGKMERKRMAQERREYNRNLEYARRQEEQRLSEQQSKDDEKQARREEQRKRYQQLRGKITEKVQDYEKSKLAEKEYQQVYLKKIPLYKRIQDQYQHETLMPELEKKKTQLAQLRNLPIDPKQIRDHARKHDELIKQFDLQTQAQLAEKDLESRIYMSSVYVSKFLYTLRDEEQKRMLEENEKDNQKKQLVDRKKNYAHLVREMFKPTVDLHKQQQLQTMIDNLHTTPKKFHSSKSRSVEEVPMKKWKKKPLEVKEPPPKRTPKFVDYLEERRLARENQVENNALDWEKAIAQQDLPEEQRANKLKKAAARIEKQLRTKEIKKGNLKASENKSLEENQEVSDMLISSIKAKLAILDK